MKQKKDMMMAGIAGFLLAAVGILIFWFGYKLFDVYLNGIDLYISDGLDGSKYGFVTSKYGLDAICIFFNRNIGMLLLPVIVAGGYTILIVNKMKKNKI